MEPGRPARVTVTGAECTGKTTLALALAERFNAPYVPEYARIHTAGRRAAAWELAELIAVAEEQARLEDEAVADAERLVVCDTDLFSIWVWHRLYAIQPIAYIRALSELRMPDLYILAGNEIPWEPDGIRDLGPARDRVHKEYELYLHEAQVPVVPVSGPHEERFAVAVHAVEGLLAAG